MDPRNALRKEIKEREEELEDLRSALKLLEKTKPFTPRLEGEAGRFQGISPKDAIAQLLEEEGGPVEEARLIELLYAGGIHVGKRPNYPGAQLSITMNVRRGNFVRNGTKIDFPPKAPAGHEGNGVG